MDVVGNNPEYIVDIDESNAARWLIEESQQRPVVIDFWASWCGPCRRSIPVLNELADAYEGRVRVYGINVEPMEPMAVREAHERLGASFPSLHDPGQTIQQAYAVTALPTLFVIDGDGQLRHTERGVPDLSDLSSVLDELLSANPQAR